jgi:hypothetical protein
MVAIVQEKRERERICLTLHAFLLLKALYFALPSKLNQMLIKEEE